MFLIGSNSIDTAGDLYTFGMNAVSKPSNQRFKRLVDVALATLLLVLAPIILWFQKNPLGLLRNVVLIFIGKRTWVGYAQEQRADQDFHLPKLSKGVLSPLDGMEDGNLDAEGLVRLNMRYAKDYSAANDLGIVLKGFRELGR
jgi:lipopolysaccharide/colanic/teichoic acid biosynthesis glycosyltransferase